MDERKEGQVFRSKHHISTSPAASLILLSTPITAHFSLMKQEAQLMLTTGSTRLAVGRGQQTWYHYTCYI